MPNNKIKTLIALAIALYIAALLVLVIVASHTQLVPELERELDAPPGLTLTPPDFSQIEQVDQKKSAFFGFFRPLIELQNRETLQERERLLAIKAAYEQQGNLSGKQQKQLRQLSKKYRVKEKPMAEKLALLERRIHIIPASMALAQAASESAWGTSRFAQKGHNYFGQWCFKKGCGLIPSRRPEGATHEVARFDSPLAAVRSYFRNINTHPAYTELRILRQDLARADKAITGYQLVEGLQKYSERGDEYIADLRSIISYNNLQP